jgi:hypothetical protein
MSSNPVDALVKHFFNQDSNYHQIVESFRVRLFYEAIKRSYGNATAAAELVGVTPQYMRDFKRNSCPDTEWPEDPNRAIPDPGIRLNNHKPLSDEDFAPTKIERTELDPA